MEKPREFWIRKGSNTFYEIHDDEESLDSGDMFYDAVVERPIHGGIHVIEHSAYAALEAKLKIATDALENIGSKSRSKNTQEALLTCGAWAINALAKINGSGE
jgi:hypothetical protein